MTATASSRGRSATTITCSAAAGSTGRCAFRPSPSAADLSCRERADRRRSRLRAAVGHHRLQIAARAYRQPHGSIRYFVFDLLSLDGKDWRKKPLKERRAKLAKLMAAKGISNFLVYADHVEGSGPEFFAQACAAGLEGIMSKRADAPYRSGRSKDWLKIKCTQGRGVRDRRL